MTLLELVGLKESAELKSRITAALIITAYKVLGEDPTTENHGNRVPWAKGVLLDPDGAAAKWLWPVIASINMNTTPGGKLPVIKESAAAFATGNVLVGNDATDDAILAAVADLVDIVA
jgi:hypothetical protein